jgi:hypothetical protein
MLVHETPTTKVFVTDAPSHGGAHHRYEVRDHAGNVLQLIEFQNGPIAEHGVNGVQHIDLLAIVEHRLDCFQAGPYASSTNEVACGFVGAAMRSDETRTRRRSLRGVEGTSKK